MKLKEERFRILREELNTEFQKEVFAAGSPVVIGPMIPGQIFESRQSTFFDALTLSFLPKESFETVRERLMKSMLGELSPHASANYWRRGSEASVLMPYPDDLDTTTAVFHALSSHDPAFLSGDKLGAYVKLLIALEEREAGPYKTWLVSADSPEVWRDVDPVVNAHIASFLHAQDVHLSGLDTYLLAALENSSVVSPYYPSRLLFLSFLARRKDFHPDRIRLELLELFPSLVSSGERLLALLALSDLGLSSREFLRLVEPIVFLPIQPFQLCIDRIKDGVTYFAGSKSLTIAIFLAALERIEVESAAKLYETSDADKLFAEVREVFRNRTNLLPILFQERAEKIVNDTFLASNAREKALFPFLIANMLSVPAPERGMLVHISAAHAYGWIAYTIYDHVLDKEADLRDVPFANVCLRELSSLFSRYVAQERLDHILDRVDAANTWEVSFARLAKGDDGYLFPRTLPDFASVHVLRDRSWGLILALRTFVHDPAIPLEEFLEHFIMAKQLHDDAHDWEGDLSRGQLNYVNTLVLKRFAERFPEKSSGAISPREHGEEMRRIFWFEILDTVVADILHHVAEGSRLIPKLSPLLQSFARGAEEAIAERRETKDFIARLAA